MVITPQTTCAAVDQRLHWRLACMWYDVCGREHKSAYLKRVVTKVRKLESVNQRLYTVVPYTRSAL